MLTKETFIYDYGKGKDWKSCFLRFALGFPNRYSVGMANLGFFVDLSSSKLHEGCEMRQIFFTGGKK